MKGWRGPKRLPATLLSRRVAQAWPNCAGGERTGGLLRRGSPRTAVVELERMLLW